MRLARLAFVGLVLPLGCDTLTDPAVRLAYCMEEGVKKSDAAAASIQVTCDLKLPGNYLVVLHPAGQLTNEALLAGGVPAVTIPELRSLRISDNASIYVIATNRQMPSSRTTYQNNFVRIEQLIVQAKSSQPVTVDVGGPAGARVIQAVR